MVKVLLCKGFNLSLPGLSLFKEKLGSSWKKWKIIQTNFSQLLNVFNRNLVGKCQIKHALDRVSKLKSVS